MRMFIVFFTILIFTSNAFAYCDSNMGNSAYNCTQGQFLHPDLNECITCPEGYYCTGNGIAYCCNSNTNGNFPESGAGAESDAACYKNIDCFASSGSTEQCRQYLRGFISCPNLINLHIDPQDNKCYTDMRACRLFGYENCDENQISGAANWSSDHGGGRWTVGSCSCGATDFEDPTDKLCHGKQGGAKPSATSVPYASSTINYDTPTGGYYCTRCILDNGNNKYYASSENGDGCTANLASGTVCKCETSTYHGHYRRGKCNSNENWDNNGSDICTRVPCDIPGTTTTELLPTSTDNSVCKYTRYTILADPVDDFTLGDIADTYGISVDGWVRVP